MKTIIFRETTVSVWTISLIDTTMTQKSTKVRHRYTTFFGVPKFIVALDDGCIVKVRMDMCHTIDEEIDKIKDYLDAIIKDCDKLNSANVSHNAPYIKAVAQNLLEIFKNR